MSVPYLRCASTGPDAGEAVLFLHGFMGSGADWIPITDALAGEYRCLMPDLPGHGPCPPSSDPGDYSFHGAALALIRLLDRLRVTRCALVGYSMGGRIALHLALAHPDRFTRLVLESASPGIRDDAEREARRARDEELARELETGDFALFLERWYAQPLFASIAADPARLGALVTRRLEGDPRALARALRGMGPGAQPPLWQSLDRLAVPTRAVVGERDTKYRSIAEAMRGRCPRIDAHVVAGCGHNVHFEKPAEYTEVLRSFLKRT